MLVCAVVPYRTKNPGQCGTFFRPYWRRYTLSVYFINELAVLFPRRCAKGRERATGQAECRPWLAGRVSHGFVSVWLIVELCAKRGAAGLVG